MAIELGAAYVSILPSTSKLAPELTKSMNKVTSKVGKKAGKSMGSRMASAAGKALKTGAVVGVAAVGATVGAALVGGFNNAVNRQTSKKVLVGLYGDAKAATSVMGDLRKVAGVSPLSYESYLKAAESLAYAGVEGKSATGTLENVGKAIVAAGGDSTKLDQAMGGVMKAVNNGGIAMMDSLGMISESGVPILSGLAEKFGVPIDKVKEMASAGKINIDDVMSVMQNGTGETFQKMKKAGDAASQSFGNQWKIVKDNVVNAVGDNMIPLLDKLAPMMKPIGDAIVAGIGKLPEIVEGAQDKIGALVSWFKEWRPLIEQIAIGVGTLLAPVFVSLGVKATVSAAKQVAAWAVSAAGAVKSAALQVASHYRIVGGWIASSLAAARSVAQSVALYAMYGWAAVKAAATHVASGLRIAAVWVATGARTVAAFVASTAAMVAQRTALVATTIATKAAAVGQRMLNLAMRMNPIGLIITGILALVAGLVWFFTQTKLGKAIITAVWGAIKVAIGATVDWFKNVVIPWLSAAITNIGTWFKAMGLVIKIVWTGIKTAIGAVWNWIKTYVFTPITNFVTKTIPTAFKVFVTLVRLQMQSWKLLMRTIWAWVKTYVLNPIKNFVTVTIPNAFKAFVGFIRWHMNTWKSVLNLAWRWVQFKVFRPINVFVKKTIPDAFQSFVNSIRSKMNTWKNMLSGVWNWVKNHVFKPLNNFIKNTVPDAFEKGVDSIKVFWDKLKKIASKPMKFVVDTVYNKGLVKLWNPIAGFIGKDDWKLDPVSTKNFATGGRVSGPGTSTSDSIPARLSNNEHVLSAKDVKNLGGHGSVYGLRAAAAKGWTPGLATGGTLSDAARWLQSKGARITEFGAWGQRVGRHSNGSLHYSGKAFDANYGPGGENATEKRFFDRVIPQMKSLFPKLGYIWRAAGHYNHAHVDTSGGGSVGSGSGGSGGGGWIPGLDTLVSGLKDKLKGMGGDGRMKDGMIAMGGKLLDGLADKASSVFGGGSGGGGGGGGNVPAGDVVAAVRSVAKNYGWDSGQQWKSLRWIIDKESSWDPNAANPNSSARGLFQKMTSIHGALEDTVEGQARWGLNYIKGRYTNPISAQGFHRNHGYYAKGTMNASRGWATVGEQGPELIKLRGGEQIKSNRASQRFVDSNQDAAKPVFHVEFHGRVDDPNEVVSKLQFEMNRFYSGGRYAR